MTQGLWRAIRFGIADLRGDWRRFILMIACLAIGTALIAAVNSVASRITDAVNEDAAIIMGGDVELMRGDRPATADEVAIIAQFGAVAHTVDLNVRAEADARDGFVDLVAVDGAYPLAGQVAAPDLMGSNIAAALDPGPDGMLGALADPMLMGKLGLSVGDLVRIGGTPFVIRGTLLGIPDGPARGFRLGYPVMINTVGLANLSDQTSPLPGLGTWYRYKLKLSGADAGAVIESLKAKLGETGWQIRSAREGLGPMLHYYDVFMRFLVIVGLASLLIGGVSVSSVMSGYIADRARTVAVLRSLGAARARVWTHFITQVLVLSLIGTLIGVVIGALIAFFAMPFVSAALGIAMAGRLYWEPLAVAVGIGVLTSLVFAYVPLYSTELVTPMELFRGGLSGPATRVPWRKLIGTRAGFVLGLMILAVLGLAQLSTRDFMLLLLFGLGALVLAGAMLLTAHAARFVAGTATSLPVAVLRSVARNIKGSAPHVNAVVLSVGLAVAVLVVIATLRQNLQQEFLGASVFDAPSFVAADLFDDEAAAIAAMKDGGQGIEQAAVAPLLRGSVTAIGDTPVSAIAPKGSEAAFLLSGEIPMTYRAQMPEDSRLVAGEWWPADYAGPPLVSLHQALRGSLGLKVGDTVTLDIFGDRISATIANFRDYSWQGGIDFLVTFAPGTLEAYPATLLSTVKAVPGEEDRVEARLAEALPDVRFIAIGETLNQVTSALNQLSLATAAVGGLAIGNGFLVLIGSLASGLRARQKVVMIMRVLGARRAPILAIYLVQYLVLSLVAALVGAGFGLGFAYLLSGPLITVEFRAEPVQMMIIALGATGFVAVLGGLTLFGAVTRRLAPMIRAID